MKRLVAVALPVLLASGCSFYTSDDDCQYGGGAPLFIALRNPVTGQCDGGGGGGDPCNPDKVPPESDDWAQCYGACDNLDEQSCLAAPGCRAAYVSSCIEGFGCSEESVTFYGCWGTAPSGPVEGGGCEGLDAYECSRHDDCSAQHYAGTTCGGGTQGGGGADCAPTPDPSLIGNFEKCIPEPVQQTGCFEDYECPSGQRCNAAEVCLPPPYGCGVAGGESDTAVPCDPRCYGWCVPINTDAGNCYEEALCDIVQPNCPDGTLPGIKNGCYTGYCIPVAECPDDPPDHGNCYEDVWCDSLPPTCPDGQIPGVTNHCWSGYCIAVDACPDPAPACEQIYSEDACVARVDCTPIYQGVNCTCNADGCTCQDWIFQNCLTNPAI